MGNDKLFQKKKIKKPRQIQRKVYIFCEGEKTEPNYFNSKKNEIKNIIRKDPHIYIKGTGHNTLSLLDYIKKRKKDKENKYEDGLDEVRAVFDKDSFSDDDFDNSINSAQANDINVAYSNESFELRYILHFDYYCKHHERSKSANIINYHIGKIRKKYSYTKKDPNIYSYIKDKEGEAIKNAKKLDKHHNTSSNISPHDRNPSTTVYKLVERLNRLKDID